MTPDRASNFEDRQARFMYALGQLDLIEEIKPYPVTPEWQKDYDRVRSEFTQIARWFGHAIAKH